jgi:hypothetical protein
MCQADYVAEVNACFSLGIRVRRRQHESRQMGQAGHDNAFPASISITRMCLDPICLTHLPEASHVLVVSATADEFPCIARRTSFNTAIYLNYPIRKVLWCFGSVQYRSVECDRSRRASSSGLISNKG